ncbi:MAG TPA: E3 binding domain-containing protein, partial [Solirubrobacteraceae bacterium]|nr:E3 binding domain-containing protein [Solirubrobacteraceae bacterium]
AAVVAPGTRLAQPTPRTLDTASVETVTELAAPAPEGMKVSPVAARVAAAEGVDLAGVTGSGPGGRVTKADVLAAGDAPAATATAATAQPLRGGAAMLAKYMDESRSIP